MVALGKATNKFLAWTASQRIETLLNLEERFDGRYVTCNEDVKRGQDLIRVPLNACIIADTLETLAERLAYERNLGSRSNYAPYIDVLPVLNDNEKNNSSLLSLPRFWDSTRLDQVKDCGQLVARIRRDERKNVDQWALACVDSRANFLGDGMYAMTPFLDMINHDGSIHTRARIEKDETYADSGSILHLNSGKSFSKGEEVFISYGNLTNLDTFVDYGFITENNPCNAECIRIRMLRKPTFSMTVYADGSIDAGSMATLRYYLANEEDLLVFSSVEDGQGLGILAKPLSDRNELEVTSFVASTIAEALDEVMIGASHAENDSLVSRYLRERSKLLDLAIQKIKQKNPDLQY